MLKVLAKILIGVVVLSIITPNGFINHLLVVLGTMYLIEGVEVKF